MKHPVATLGGMISLVQPTFNDRIVAGVACALARQCRWDGHVRRTVAEHNLMVGRQAWALAYEDNAPHADRVMAMFFGANHDTHEGISGDVSSPVKRYLEDVVRMVGSSDAVVEALRSALEFPQIDHAFWTWAAEKTGKPIAFFEEMAVKTAPWVKKADAMALSADFLAFPEALRTEFGWAPAEAPTEMAWREGAKAVPNNALDLAIDVDGPATEWLATLGKCLDTIKALPE
jgi:5'-deoxynucleotidase YfbR-like HD superfamily hydrolase